MSTVMEANQSYDLAIIGGGSAGLTALCFAVELDVRVALVENTRIGGDCTWTGCVPSKTLLKAAKVAHQMRTAREYGLIACEPEVDLQRVMSHVRKIVAEVAHEESPEVLRSSGADVYMGGARFLDPHTLAAGNVTLRARHVLIATGAHPFIPPIEGLGDVDYLTYETIWDLEDLPERLLVLGGGPVGCEMAQAFRRFGSSVALFGSKDRLLTRDDVDASRVLREVFSSEGIDVHLGARGQRVWQDASGIHLVAGAPEEVGDALLIAAGRRPSLKGLGLEQAGVAFTDKGITVDQNLRTSQRHIYAAGDVTGGYQFTHYAGWQAAMAVRNALLPGSSAGVTDRVPWTTFTDPEVAQAGLTEQQARKRYGDDVLTHTWPMSQVDRARTEGSTEGFTKIVHRRDNTLLGATIVAERAGEAIHEWVVALAQGMKVSDLATIIHVYPTYSTAAMQAAAAIRIEGMMGGASGRVIRGLAQLIQ